MGLSSILAIPQTYPDYQKNLWVEANWRTNQWSWVGVEPYISHELGMDANVRIDMSNT